MKNILVTGATGNVGRQVVTQLLAADVRVRAMARSPERAGLPRQVEVVRCDLTVPTTLDRCLEGVDAVFLVWQALICAWQDVEYGGAATAPVTSTVAEITGVPPRSFHDWVVDHAAGFQQ